MFKRIFTALLILIVIAVLMLARQFILLQKNEVRLRQKQLEAAAIGPPTAYTEFNSLNPQFYDDTKLEAGTFIELTPDDIKELYREFKGTIVTPLDPGMMADPKAYRINSAEVHFKRCASLCVKLNQLIYAISIDGFDKYGRLLTSMRDVLYIDATCLKRYMKWINGEVLPWHDIWYRLHNEWLKTAENRYTTIFEQKIRR